MDILQKGVFFLHWKMYFFKICISLQQCMTAFAWSLIRTFLPLSRAFTQIHRRIQPGGGFRIWGIHSQVLLLTYLDRDLSFVYSHQMFIVSDVGCQIAKISEVKWKHGEKKCVIADDSLVTLENLIKLMKLRKLVKQSEIYNLGQHGEPYEEFESKRKQVFPKLSWLHWLVSE